MAPDAFGAWSLILQLSAYVGYLDFGIQTAISRFVAHSTERGDTAQRDGIVSTALACLSVACCAAVAGLLVLAFVLPEVFHSLPCEMVGQVRVALLLVGGSLALGLPSSAFAGTFVGLQRNEVPGAIVGGSRIVSAASLILIVRSGGGIVAMGVTVAAVNVASYGLHYVAYRRAMVHLQPAVHLSLEKVSRSAAKELFDYCFSLTVWALGLLLVTGLDLTIVGIYSFPEIGYYAVAATVVTFLAGIFAALFGAMGAPAAVIHARGDRTGLGRFVLVTTRFGVILLLAAGLPLIVFSRPLLQLWVGTDYALHGAILLQVLLAANVIRISVTPYVLAMLGSGEQSRIILVPLLEGVTNLALSLLLAHSLGALGVALGTLIGAVVGLLGTVLYNIKRTPAIHMSAREYVLNSLLRPCLWAVPLVFLASVWRHLPSSAVSWICGIAAGAVSAFLLWSVSLISADRSALFAAIASRLPRQRSP
jgi:O-antigen/teichoic acid export membrane protein